MQLTYDCLYERITEFTYSDVVNWTKIKDRVRLQKKTIKTYSVDEVFAISMLYYALGMPVASLEILNNSQNYVQHYALSYLTAHLLYLTYDYSDKNLEYEALVHFEVAVKLGYPYACYDIFFILNVSSADPELDDDILQPFRDSLIYRDGIDELCELVERGDEYAIEKYTYMQFSVYDLDPIHNFTHRSMIGDLIVDISKGRLWPLYVLFNNSLPLDYFACVQSIFLGKMGITLFETLNNLLTNDETVSLSIEIIELILQNYGIVVGETKNSDIVRTNELNVDKIWFFLLTDKTNYNLLHDYLPISQEKDKEIEDRFFRGVGCPLQLSIELIHTSLVQNDDQLYQCYSFIIAQLEELTKFQSCHRELYKTCAKFCSLFLEFDYVGFAIKIMLILPNVIGDFVWDLVCDPITNHDEKQLYQSSVRLFIVVWTGLKLRLRRTCKKLDKYFGTTINIDRYNALDSCKYHSSSNEKCIYPFITSVCRTLQSNLDQLIKYNKYPSTFNRYNRNSRTRNSSHRGRLSQSR